jgi:glycosyltransferase involved in cell wall biosynthesis
LRRLNRNVRVVPNYIRVEDWPDPPSPADEPPTIVIAGSFTHHDDWKPVASALAWARKRHGARVRVCGYLPDYLQPVCDDYRPWVDLAAYPAMLAGGAIGLCPLPDNGFNRCKSPIKAYEYALAGMAVIASPCQYGPLLRESGLGAYVVRDGGDWRAPLDALLSDAVTRHQAATTLRTHVRTTYDVRRHAATIRAAYAA